MNTRREFLSGSVFSLLSLPVLNHSGLKFNHLSTFDNTRKGWAALAYKVALPVFENMAEGKLKVNMPLRLDKAELARQMVAPLEALGRSFYGLSPWLGSKDTDPETERLRSKLVQLFYKCLDQGLKPNGPDSFYFDHPQALVDMAFLVFGLLQSWESIWLKLPDETKQQVLTAAQKADQIKPYNNNWLLFSAMVAHFLHKNKLPYDEGKIEMAINSHLEWYKGDGWFGDGAEFHFDYYNSFVIQPFLLELIDYKPDKKAAMLQVAQRFAIHQERMIASDGTFPSIGRSLAYRCGAFHHLAFMAFKQQLPVELKEGQVRRGLARVIERTLVNESNFSNGWLRVGISGEQPGLGEVYITTASLYLCLFAFLPLGLEANHIFWTCAEEPLTVEKAFGGIDLPADKALKTGF